MNVKVSIITVTYNSEKVISDFLVSVKKFQPKDSEIIIVDCASSDDTVLIIDKIRGAHLIKSDLNLGFGKGNNLGEKFAQGKYLLFLNPDIAVFDKSLTKLVEYADRVQDFGIIAPKLIKNDGSIQKSVRNLPTFIGAFSEYFINIKDSFNEYAPVADEPLEVDCVYGAAYLIKKDIFESVGGFNEKYFLYYEDLDLCRKIKELGKRIIYYPQSSLRHAVGHTKVDSAILPPVVRTIANFYPFKASGKNYYQIRGENLYHGVIKASLIRLLIYISLKLKIYKNN